GLLLYSVQSTVTLFTSTQPGRTAYFRAEEEGLGKSVMIIEAIKRRFIIQLPFDYKKAVLTQARTSPHRPYAFIVEFNDGIRKFMKGPFKSADLAQDHVICNEIKRRLASKYLHPIQCEIKGYGAGLFFLECEEIGRADLSRVTIKRTKLEVRPFEVLEYGSNDVVPDPLAFLSRIDDKNRDIWIEVMVNYCFRWVFGIGDTARRNLMLQRSTGRIYSTDETGVETVSHENVWGGKKSDRKTFELVRDCVESDHFNEVLIEVKSWKESLGLIRREVVPLSLEVDGRINKLLNDPKIVFDI
ncbi:hypothetical protein ACFL0M_16005, partial [Thermodesulfobacteriota bacterium]